MSFSFHPEAEKELNEAIDYYEDIEAGLGYDFVLAVRSTISRSVDFRMVFCIPKRNAKYSLWR